MTRFRSPHRRDSNHRAIVDGLRTLGYSVLDISSVGGNCPDILVGFDGESVLVEVKSKGKDVTPGQRAFAETWKGRVFTVHSLDEALSELGKMRR